MLKDDRKQMVYWISEIDDGILAVSMLCMRMDKISMSNKTVIFLARKM